MKSFIRRRRSVSSGERSTGMPATLPRRCTPRPAGSVPQVAPGAPVVREPRQPGEPHLVAGVWRVQQQAVTGVDADVVDRGPVTGPEEDQVTAAQRCALDLPAVPSLV